MGSCCFEVNQAVPRQQQVLPTHHCCFPLHKAALGLCKHPSPLPLRPPCFCLVSCCSGNNPGANSGMCCHVLPVLWAPCPACLISPGCGLSPGVGLAEHLVCQPGVKCSMFNLLLTLPLFLTLPPLHTGCPPLPGEGHKSPNISGCCQRAHGICRAARGSPGGKGAEREGGL